MKVNLYTDGGARGNPGPAAAGVVIFDEAGKVLAKKSKYLGETTNNQAEYQGLILGLSQVIKLAKIPAIIDLTVHMDSELVIKQMLGEYRVKEATLVPLHTKAGGLAKKFGRVTFLHVRRAKNAIADKLVNDELDSQ